MRKNKIIVATVISVAMLGLMFGCGKGDTTTTDTTTTDTTTIEETSTKDTTIENVNKDSTEKDTDDNNTTETEQSVVEKNESETTTNNTHEVSVDTSKIKTDYVVSSGLELKEKSDGTYEITGKGTCTDEIIVISSEMDNKTISVVSEKAFNSEEIKGIVFQDAKDIKVDNRAFYYCDDLSLVQIVNSSVEIDEYNFYDSCDDATVIFYNSTIKTDSHAFDSADIAEVSIIACDMEIGDRTFYYCDSINKFIIDSSNLKIGEYILYDSGDDMELSITNSKVDADSHAFDSCAMKSIYSSKCDLDFDDRVFYYCDKLETVNIDANTLEVGEYCFYTCKNLIEVNLCVNDSTDNTSVKLCEHSFDGCESLETVKIGNGKIEIDDRVFYYCSKLKEVMIESSNVSFGEYVFYECPKDAKVTYGGKTVTIDSFE